MDSIEILAREMALADINKHRAVAWELYREKLPPLLTIPAFYWQIFGAEWMAKAADFSDYSI